MQAAPFEARLLRQAGRRGACFCYVGSTIETPFAITRDGERLVLDGDLRMRDASSIWRALRDETRETKGALTIDVANVNAIDGGIVSLVVALRADLSARGVRTEIVGEPSRFRALFDLYDADAPPRRPKKRRPVSAIAQIGGATAAIGREGKAVVAFFGEMVVALAGLVRSPRSGHWKEIPPLMEKTGADAVPIVVLINFLIGAVLAYQSSKQLKMFGANIFVADLVGLSVTRELAPLMTAIIVCGRSGAAFAAEIGSMKVSEEIDALRTLGLRPFSWLVVPRVIALFFVLPALTAVADVVSVLGGIFVAVTSLDLTFQGYLVETQKSVELWDVGHGISKSFAFAIAIALISCQQGFAASGGAEGVGKRTTGTVVASLFTLVVIDALFTIVFRAFGL
jgi:phospholipid/cholesterol/gamma-HCH transport system permease protein